MNTKLLPANLLFLFSVILYTAGSAQITPHDAISQMRKGINLGNTLEPAYEGDWGNPSTQEYMFDMYKKEGFQCIRVPVRWDKHMGTTSPFKISETWFARVEQILDWGLSRGLYVIVNSHHDGWIKEGYDNPVNQARFDSLWSQVATRFKNKPDRLIFEICNEPVSPMTKAQNDAMHQSAIDIIRKTNPTRLIIFQGIDWGSSDGLLNAAIPPNDPYLIGSFHSYDPYPFGLVGTGTFTTADVTVLKAKFQKVKDWSLKNNIPVILGEFGGSNKCEYNARMRQYKTYVELSESFGFSSCAWDDGGEFKIMNRSAKTWYDDIKDILAHSSILSPKSLRFTLVQDTIIKLDWTNNTTTNDSIYIERRTASTTFKRVAALKGDTSSFSEYKLPRNTEYYYRVIAHFTDNTLLYSHPQKFLLPTYIPKEPVVRKYFTGQPLSIPGKIEAENFDIGEDGMTYHDSDTKNITGDYRPNEPIDIYDLGNNIFYVIDNLTGEWIEYTVNVAQTGQYDISVPIAAPLSGGTFKIKIGNVESNLLKVPSSRSQIITKPLLLSMNLEAGIQIMRISILNNPTFNIDYFDFVKSIPSSISNTNTMDLFLAYQQDQELIINTDNNDFESVMIYNILGSLVKTSPITSTTFKTSTREMHPGVYVVQLINRNKRVSKKIIIK